MPKLWMSEVEITWVLEQVIHSITDIALNSDIKPTGRFLVITLIGTRIIRQYL